MQPHQQRVVEELRELNDKRAKLRTFMDGEIYPKLDEAERGRLIRQDDAMERYAVVLDERIKAF